MLSFVVRSSRVGAMLFGCGLFALACGGSTSDPIAETRESPPAGSQETTSPPAATTPAAPNPAPIPTTSPPGACNAIANPGSAIGATMIAAPAPTPAGGAIPNGTYRLTELSVYTGPGGATGSLPLTIKSAIEVHGGTIDVVQEANGDLKRLTESVTTSGTTASFATTCPSTSQPKSGQYSATSTTLSLFLVNDVGQTVVYVYAK